jgi:hypothetical protein
VEVKSGSGIRPEDLAGLKAFRKDYPEAQVALLARDPVKSEMDGIPIHDVATFLRRVVPGHPLPVRA